MRLRWLGALVALLSMTTGGSLQAYEVRLTTTNDFFTINDIDDDLYTFSTEFEFNRGVHRIRLAENAFTDEINGVRFDETYLTIGRAIEPIGEWQPELEFGVLYVGEGLLGQSFQNSIHRSIGNLEVRLPYVEERELFPTFRASATRGIILDERSSVHLYGELFTAPGFKTTATAGSRVFTRPHRNVRIQLGVGVRATEADYDPLTPWIDGFGFTYEVGFRLWEHFEISWDYNRFGTEMQHVNLSYLWKPKAPRPRN